VRGRSLGQEPIKEGPNPEGATPASKRADRRPLASWITGEASKEKQVLPRPSFGSVLNFLDGTVQRYLRHNWAARMNVRITPVAIRRLDAQFGAYHDPRDGRSNTFTLALLPWNLQLAKGEHVNDAIRNALAMLNDFPGGGWAFVEAANRFAEASMEKYSWSMAVPGFHILQGQPIETTVQDGNEGDLRKVKAIPISYLNSPDAPVFLVVKAAPRDPLYEDRTGKDINAYFLYNDSTGEPIRRLYKSLPGSLEMLERKPPTGEAARKRQVGDPKINPMGKLCLLGEDHRWEVATGEVAAFINTSLDDRSRQWGALTHRANEAHEADSKAEAQALDAMADEYMKGTDEAFAVDVLAHPDFYLQHRGDAWLRFLNRDSGAPAVAPGPATKLDELKHQAREIAGRLKTAYGETAARLREELAGVEAALESACEPDTDALASAVKEAS